MTFFQWLNENWTKILGTLSTMLTTLMTLIASGAFALDSGGDVQGSDLFRRFFTWSTTDIITGFTYQSTVASSGVAMNIFEGSTVTWRTNPAGTNFVSLTGSGSGSTPSVSSTNFAVTGTGVFGNGWNITTSGYVTDSQSRVAIVQQDQDFSSATAAGVFIRSSQNASGELGIRMGTNDAASGSILLQGCTGATTTACGNQAFFFDDRGKLTFDSTDSSGTPGAATIDKAAGTSAVAAAANSVVITNALVAATSKVLINIRSADTTCIIPRAVPGAGSFTLTMYSVAMVATNCTANLTFDWVVH